MSLFERNRYSREEWRGDLLIKYMARAVLKCVFGGWRATGARVFGPGFPGGLTGVPDSEGLTRDSRVSEGLTRDSRDVQGLSRDSRVREGFSARLCF